MRLKIEYDADTDAAYIHFSAAAVVESEEVSRGIVLDYDEEGRIAGMELPGASGHLSPTLLRRRHPRPARVSRS
ncbi:DUF2283 domain-containing protein [Chelativorans salis]|uniref:DUF2283 domain-containing protein n=1 Tax=Chelativorans salis TaxID=2978478 RepID=A0ABT2LNZ0_9HYPH|nr:DUF2283 domain-containing protein [Chelativorans sp. EGI FJ00035]MCT7376134.1 DUF2283 domain-containing protein [Chelativorans sp. EGI FJ00035]